MSDSRPSLKSQNLWAKREARCLAILERALLVLRVRENLPEAEVELNRLLLGCLLAASRELYPREEITPTLECNNQPDPDDESRAVREQKRPDFQWIYLDRYEPDPRHSSKQFVVECKRLGKPTRAERVFNSNYVNRGVCRFQDEQWAYAKGFSSGAMVGYWQSMDAENILAEVTGELHKHSLPEIVLKGTWKNSAVSHLAHSFERSFEISPFQLRHLWVDVRKRG